VRAVFWLGVGLRDQEGLVSIGKLIKKILKPFVLALLRGAEKDVEANWQRKQGPK
jgi:hypothetical protein